jgi:hypothetical protein
MQDKSPYHETILVTAYVIWPSKQQNLWTLGVILYYHCQMATLKNGRVLSN